MKFLLKLWLPFLLAVSGPVLSQNYSLESNVPYTPTGGDDLQTLDIYQPPTRAIPFPIVIYVHGGGWKGGDKENTAFKDELFTQNGYVFVSVNYRLSPDPVDLRNPNALRHPVHGEDVAQAIAFIHQNASRWNANPDRIYLLGHSAGAHLVSLVSTDDRYLKKHQLSLGTLRCTISLDTAVYDLPFYLNTYGTDRVYLNAFGTDPIGWAEASPITYAVPNKSIPSFLLVHQNTEERITVSQRFASALSGSNVPTTLLNARSYDHGEINRRLGDPKAPVYTQAVLDYLKTCDR